MTEGTRSISKKAAAAPALTEVQSTEQAAEELPEEVKLQLDMEQQRLESATMGAQLGYLSNRIAELVKENHELRSQLGKI